MMNPGSIHHMDTTPQKNRNFPAAGAQPADESPRLPAAACRGCLSLYLYAQ
jgi:hypothetical protein